MLHKQLKKALLSLFLISIIIFNCGFIGMSKFLHNLTNRNVQLVQMSEFKESGKNYLLLDDGRIALVGQKVEIYDPATNQSEVIGELIDKDRMYDYTVTLLKNNQILITGGRFVKTYPELKGTPEYTKGFLVNTVEIFDLDTGKSRVVGKTNYTRNRISKALLLNDGRVLITGGNYYNKKTEKREASPAEIFDPKTEKFTVIKEPAYQRIYPYFQINDNELFISVLKYEDKLFEYEHSDLKQTAMVVVSSDLAIYDIKNNTYSIKDYKFDGSIRLQLDNENILWSDNRYPLKVGLLNLKTDKIESYINPFDKKNMLKRSQRKVVLSENGNVLILGGYKRFISYIPIFDVLSFNPNTKEFKKLGETLHHAHIGEIFRLNNGNIAFIVHEHANPKDKIYIYDIKDGDKTNDNI